MRLVLTIAVSVFLFGCGGADAGIFNEKTDGATSAETSSDDETGAVDSDGTGATDTSMTIEGDDGPPSIDDGPPPSDSGPPKDSGGPPKLDTGTVLPDTAVPPDAPVIGGCPEPGGKTYMGHCYFPTMMRSWLNNRDTCAYFKAHLVTITSAGEQAFVNGISSGERWIGMFRPEGTALSESSYRWINTDAVSYTNWEPSEPNFSGSCVRLRGDGTWADYSCSTSLTAICERE